MAIPSTYTVHGTAGLTRVLRRVGRIPGNALEMLGHQITFCFKVLVAIPHTVRSYQRQMLLILSDITWGNGKLIVGGGTVSVLSSWVSPWAHPSASKDSTPWAWSGWNRSPASCRPTPVPGNLPR